MPMHTLHIFHICIDSMDWVMFGNIWPPSNNVSLTNNYACNKKRGSN